MRLTPVIVAAFILSMGVSSVAQEWTEYVSKEDRFSTNFPGQPTVTNTIYKSQFGADLPARVYSAMLGPSRFSLTVVDYRDIERILTEKAKACPAGSEPCRGGFSSTGPGYSWADRAGALIYATWQVMQRDAKVTEYSWNNINQVVGQQLFLTSNADKSRTMVSMYMHDDRLYIAEGTVPAGYPEPGLFLDSLAFLDSNGNSVRYDSHYVNGQPVPTFNGGQVRTDPGAGGARYGGPRGGGAGGRGRGGPAAGEAPATVKGFRTQDTKVTTGFFVDLRALVARFSSYSKAREAICERRDASCCLRPAAWRLRWLRSFGRSAGSRPNGRRAAEQDVSGHPRGRRRTPEDRTVQGVRQSLLRRPVLRVGVAGDDAAGPHSVRFRAGTLRRSRHRQHQESRHQSQGHQIHRSEPRPSRPCRRRRTAAGSHRRPRRGGRRGLDDDRSAGWQGPADATRSRIACRSATWWSRTATR